MQPAFAVRIIANFRKIRSFRIERQPGRLARVSFLLLTFVATLASWGENAPAPTRGFAMAARSTVAMPAGYGKLALSFEANRGQSNSQVQFLSHGHGYSLFLTGREAVMVLQGAKAAHLMSGHPAAGVSSSVAANSSGSAPIDDVVRMRLVGARSHTAVTGEIKLPGTANYFIGNDPSKWQRDVPTFARVRYTGVYRGVDLVYYGNQQQLEYDLEVAPGADANAIRIRFDGARKISLDGDGSLRLEIANGKMAFRAPAIYQTIDGRRRAVDGRFVLAARNTIAFSIGKYDRGNALVIDPTLVYSTFLGGQGASNALGGQATAIAVDAQGNAYVAGTTVLPDFPTTQGAFQPDTGGKSPSISSQFSFVAKINPAGTGLVYSTFLGGTGQLDQQNDTLVGDSISSIFVDSTGNAYLAGAARSPNFPVTPGAYQTTNKATYSPSSNGFLTKLNPAGNKLVYSTFLGGGERTPNDPEAPADVCTQVAVTAAGEAYVVGTAQSLDFPTTPDSLQSKLTNPSQEAYKAYVAAFNTTGTKLIYSTYLGGSKWEWGNAIAVDAKGDAYVAGETNSSDFPVSSNAFQNTNYAAAAGGGETGFVAKLNPAGTALLYSTYLGGAGSSIAPTFQVADAPTGIAVDSTGEAYITGLTTSQDFPLKNAIQGKNKTYLNTDTPYVYTTAFVSKLNASGSALVFSTYLGSSGGEVIPGNLSVWGVAGETEIPATDPIALDKNGNVYVTGTTYGIDFPVTNNAFEGTNPSAGHSPGNADTNLGYVAASASGWFTELSAAGALEYSTYLGGSAYYPASFGFAGSYDGDYGIAIALDPAGDAYIAGTAQSPDFPVTPGSYLTSKTAQSNAFVSKFSLSAASTGATITTMLSSANPQLAGDSAKFTAFVQSRSGGAVPTGSIGFTVDGGTKTPEDLDDTGHASFTTSALSDGSHVIQASYSGDSTYSPSTGSLTEVASGAPTTIQILSGSNQTGIVNAFFPNQVVVKVTDAAGTPVPNAEVSFGGQGMSYFDLYLNQNDFGPTGLTSLNGETEAAVFPTSFGKLTGTVSVAGVGSPVFLSFTAIKGYLTVDATNLSVHFDQPIPPLTYSVKGFVDGDTSSILSGKAVLTTTAKKGSPAGRYPITVSKGTMAAANYGFTTVNGTLTITEAETAAPTFSLKAGTYKADQKVTVKDTTPGAKIHCTTTGATPTAASPLCAASIAVDKTTTIKAIAIAPGFENSAVVTAKYVIDLPPAVTTKAATVIATSTATLNASVTDKDVAGTAWFEYGTSKTALTRASLKKEVAASAAAENVDEAVSGLKANTVYYFKAIIQTAGGTASGAVLSFKTK